MCFEQSQFFLITNNEKKNWREQRKKNTIRAQHDLITKYAIIFSNTFFSLSPYYRFLVVGNCQVHRICK